MFDYVNVSLNFFYRDLSCAFWKERPWKKKSVLCILHKKLLFYRMFFIFFNSPCHIFWFSETSVDWWFLCVHLCHPFPKHFTLGLKPRCSGECWFDNYDHYIHVHVFRNQCCLFWTCLRLYINSSAPFVSFLQLPTQGPDEIWQPSHETVTAVLLLHNALKVVHP